jgi:hypothetical protein
MVQPLNRGIKRALDGTPSAEFEEDLPHHDDEASTPQAEPCRRSVREIGGPAEPEPTRYGDWERKGRCVDF